MMEMKQLNSGWMMLPPAPDKCQVCATAHDPALPHNQQSLFYQFAFNDEHGRSPTWRDAWAHCTLEVQTKWIHGFYGLIRDGKAGVVVSADDNEKELNLVLGNVCKVCNAVDITVAPGLPGLMFFNYDKTAAGLRMTDKSMPNVHYFKVIDLCLPKL